LGRERAGANAGMLLRVIAGLMVLCILVAAAFLVYTRVAA
jgi:hypothetical protein